MVKPIARVSTQSMKAMDVAPAQVQAFKESLQAACVLFQIDTPARVAGFLSQAAHESNLFKTLQENLVYRTPERILKVFPSRVKSLAQAECLVSSPRELANTVYCGRLGNGDQGSDEGWVYRGRGLFQITGKANYEAAAKALGHPYLTCPEMLMEPTHAALTAAWFWYQRGCNELADRRLFTQITQQINGPALLGHAERMVLYTQAINGLE